MHVAEIWRYPVKGLRGERLEAARVEPGGIPGDRSVCVVDERGIVTGRRKQRMLGAQASLDGTGNALVGGHPWDSAEASALIGGVAGESAQLQRPEGGHRHDAADVLLLSDGSVGQLGYDRRRYRPNFLIEGADGPVELGWIGRHVRLGAVLLRVDEPCERCVITTIDPDTIEVDLAVLERTRDELDGLIGVYCTVAEPGTVRVGDAVAEED